jgi:hypothetical protein
MKRSRATEHGRRGRLAMPRDLKTRAKSLEDLKRLFAPQPPRPRDDADELRGDTEDADRGS